MRTVYKYVLDLRNCDSWTVVMPKGAALLGACYADDPSRLAIWAEIETEAETERRRFWVVGTGDSIPPSCCGNHVASVWAAPFAWHVYEWREAAALLPGPREAAP
jgi:hypothetical protein